MYSATLTQQLPIEDKFRPSWIFPARAVVQRDLQVVELLADLSPEVAWGDRQRAARRLGNMRSREALPELLTALGQDPFWMVRHTIIQALEKIGDPAAIPALQDAARNDGFLTVRSYAEKAVTILSQ
jgi:HEAT repeat protein